MKKRTYPIVVALLGLIAAACGPSTNHPDSGGGNDVQVPNHDEGVVTDTSMPRADTGPMTDPCAVNTDCDSCARDSSNVCGWCAGSNSCRTGTMTGPTDMSCTATQWSWTPDVCPGVAAACAAATDCASCTAMGTCGFCGNTGMCRTGTANGPNDMSCTMAMWSWQATDCSGGDGGAPTDAAPAPDASH